MSCADVEALTCRPQRLTGKKEIMPFHVLYLYFFYYCGDTQINKLEGKTHFKKLIDPSCSVFSPASYQRYCPSEYIHSVINWICAGVYLKTTSLFPPNWFLVWFDLGFFSRSAVEHSCVTQLIWPIWQYSRQRRARRTKESGGRGDSCAPKSTCQDDVYLKLGDTDSKLHG